MDRNENQSILKIFVGTKCESCGMTKEENMAFCRVCYWKLPALLRNPLWNRFGMGFEEAYARSLAWLNRPKGGETSGD